ncbi:MAG: hypothetical protein BA866_06410 [Desulfobulbaceae bacterium S5133MH15]|nr:MAG: hypothetical protein BA866_06410 [Desulfobulbaceae bacterium S5133MH15]
MFNNRAVIWVLFFSFFQLQAMLPLACNGNWLNDAFIDPSDGKLDMSNWLLERDGLMPVPIIITEPAIGYGGGLALVYFHDKVGSRKGSPPSVSAVAGAATENGTWFAGGGHLGIWKNDTIRYSGGLGTGLVKMDYYGRSGNQEQWQDGGIRFETDALFFVQELLFRIYESKFFAGLGYVLIDTANSFEHYSEDLTQELPGFDFDSRSAAVNLMLSYDSRDNIFTPSNGMAAEAKVMLFDDIWGSDDTFQKYLASLLYYNSLTENLVLGLRGSGQVIEGDAPFYSYPFIDMRGVKAMQYQGDMTLLGEVEVRWSFTPRWALVGFGGAGKAYNDGEKEDSDVIYSKGIGIRYLIASKLGLQVGLDVAQGPDDTAFYIQFGSSWSLK